MHQTKTKHFIGKLFACSIDFLVAFSSCMLGQPGFGPNFSVEIGPGIPRNFRSPYWVFPLSINEKLIDFCKGNFMCSIYITYRKLAAVTYFQSAMLAVRRGQSLANETPLTLCREKLYRHLFTADFWLMNEGENSNPLHKYLHYVYVCKAEGKNLNTWFELNEQQSCKAAPHHQRTPFI